MSHPWLSVLSFLFVAPLLGLVACTPKSDGGSDTGRPQYLGDLDKKAQEIYSKDNEINFYSCDHEWKDRVLEIARSVEAHRDQITSLINQIPANSSDFKTKDIGGVSFREPTKREAMKDQWMEDRDSWAQAAILFKEVQDDPTNKNWIGLNVLVRSLISEDEDRISYVWHPWVRRESETVVKESFAAIQDCLSKADCYRPSLTPDQKTWVNKSHNLKIIFEGLEGSSPVADKRRWLNSVLKNISMVKDRYEGQKNLDAKIDENGTLIVPMNLDVFGSDAGKFSAMIEQIWNTEGLHISVRNVSTNQPAFKVQVSDLPGERDYVSRSGRLMQLYKPGQVWTVAHEFGHVLGLRDQYYTSFDAETCEYIYQVNLANLMSISSTGQVLKSHAEALRKLYY